VAAAQLLARDSEKRDAFAFVCTANVCTDRVSSPQDLTGLITTFGLPKPGSS